MIFQEAIRNGKGKANPARLVRLHREENSRVRFITYAEEAIIREIIRQRCPIHEPEFTLALETGMRRGELYALEWDRVDFERRQLLFAENKKRDGSGGDPHRRRSERLGAALEEEKPRLPQSLPHPIWRTHDFPACVVRARHGGSH